MPGYRSREELQEIAQKAMLALPKDLNPSELAVVISEMLKSESLRLRGRGF